MTYAIGCRSRVRTRVRPFRLLAAFLTLLVFFMLFGILSTPNYDEELARAKEDYLAASQENARLRGELRDASLRQAEEAAAR